jgi:hypothetical protein
MMGKIDFFMAKLENDLYERYQVCEGAYATPSSILRAVLNAVAEARKKTIELYGEDKAWK